MQRCGMLTSFCCLAAAALAQSLSQPINDLPNPFRTVRDWRELPAGTAKWAAVTAGWKKGIRIARAKDGSVKYFIQDIESTTTEHSGGEGVGVDSDGNVYGAVVRRQMLEKHIRILSPGAR